MILVRHYEAKKTISFAQSNRPMNREIICDNPFPSPFLPKKKNCIQKKPGIFHSSFWTKSAEQLEIYESLVSWVGRFHIIQDMP